MAKVDFIGLGCPKNLVDSEVMLGLLARDGHSITPDQSLADIIVVNTCGFIESAKQESIDTILEMARQKVEGNCKRLIVAGCLVQRYRREITEEIPEIDGVVYLTDGLDEWSRPGELREVLITEAHDYDLVGQVTA